MLSEILRANLRDVTPCKWVHCHKFGSKLLTVFSVHAQEENCRSLRNADTHLPNYTVSIVSVSVVLNNNKNERKNEKNVSKERQKSTTKKMT
jgi:hypothetical protein